MANLLFLEILLFTVTHGTDSHSLCYSSLLVGYMQILYPHLYGILSLVFIACLSSFLRPQTLQCEEILELFFSNPPISQAQGIEPLAGSQRFYRRVES